MDDCASVPCENNASCEDIGQGFQCQCGAGFTGDTCGEDIDECETGSHRCEQGSTCSNALGTYTCLCPDGITGKENLFWQRVFCTLCYKFRMYLEQEIAPNYFPIILKMLSSTDSLCQRICSI